MCACLLDLTDCLRFLRCLGCGVYSPPHFLFLHCFLKVDLGFPALMSNFSEARTHLKALQVLLSSPSFAGFFFAVLRTWPVLALLRLSLWTGHAGLKCGNSGTRRLLGKLRNSTTHIYDFFGWKMVSVCQALAEFSKVIQACSICSNTGSATSASGRVASASCFAYNNCHPGISLPLKGSLFSPQVPTTGLELELPMSWLWFIAQKERLKYCSLMR